MDLKAEAGWYLLRSLASYAVGASPARLWTLGRLVGSLAVTLSRKRKKIALDYISLALPELGRDERGRVLAESIQRAAAGFLEVFHYPASWPRGLGNFRIEGEEHLRAAKGGAVLLTAHLGCFPMMFSYLAEVGWPVAVVRRDPHDRRLARLFDRGVRRTGLVSISDRPPNACARACLEHVRSGGLLALQIDIHTRRRGVEVEFFGRATRTFAGPANIALKTGAPVIPAFIHRDPHRPVRHVVTVMEPVELVRTGSRAEDVRTNLQEMSRATERAMRAWPEDVWWIHRRWK